MQTHYATKQEGDDTLLIRVDATLAAASEAIQPDRNGLYDREDLVQLLSELIPLVHELQHTAERERREMKRRLRRSPFLFTRNSFPPGDELPSAQAGQGRPACFDRISSD